MLELLRIVNEWEPVLLVHISDQEHCDVCLTDMCKRYANLVDPLIPQITACLKDKSLIVIIYIRRCSQILFQSDSSI